MRLFSLLLLLGGYGVLGGKEVWPKNNDERQATISTVKDKPMTREDVPGFLVIGIEVRTTNAKEATAGGVIPRQWQKFFQEGVREKIPEKIGENIYTVYTDYASDHNGEYDYVIGAKVKEGTPPPPGMVAKNVSGGHFVVFTTGQGPLSKVVPQAWQRIFEAEDNQTIQRTYKADFEIYDQRSQDPQNAQVDLYVGIK